MGAASSSVWLPLLNQTLPVTTSQLSSIAFASLALVASCARPAATSSASVSNAPPSVASTPVASVRQTTTAQAVLGPLASEPLVVLPVQTLRMTVPDWSNKVGDPRAFLATVDDEIAFAVRERGLRGKWAFGPDLARSARRNPTYAVDPYSIALDPIVPLERDPGKILGEPLAGQLRAFTGLFNARYAFVPVELRLMPDSGGARASLHAVVIDTRSRGLHWVGDVRGDVVRSFSPAVAAGLAGRVADLFIIPAR